MKSPSSARKKETPAMDAAYEETRRWVYKLAYVFHRKFGGEVEDVLARADGHWVRAYRTYDGSKAKFTTYVKHVVWRGLVDDLRRSNKSVKAVPITDLEGYEPELRLHDPTEGLSEDAELVVRVALRASASRRPGSTRKAIARVLLELGMGVEQVTKAFREVREALL